MDSPIHPGFIIGGVLAGLLTVAPGLIWLERRLLALWQDRYGPNRAGPFGILIVLADTIKLMFKEDWIPPFADKKVFVEFWVRPQDLVRPCVDGLPEDVG